MVIARGAAEAVIHGVLVEAEQDVDPGRLDVGDDHNHPPALAPAVEAGYGRARAALEAAVA